MVSHSIERNDYACLTWRRMFLVPREKLPGCVGRGVGPARLLCKDFVVARTRAVEFDEWNVLCAVGGVSSRAARFRVTRPGVEWGGTCGGFLLTLPYERACFYGKSSNNPVEGTGFAVVCAGDGPGKRTGTGDDGRYWVSTGIVCRRLPGADTGR